MPTTDRIHSDRRSDLQGIRKTGATPAIERRWLLSFLVGNLLLCLWVFRGALWGRSLLAPLDILPAVASEYRFVDPNSSGVPANHFIIDQATFDLPLQTSVYRAYRNGEIPWWDPFTVSGKPLLAEAHINGTEPIRVLAYLTLPFELAYNWTRVLNYVFGGLGMLLLLRHWKFSTVICVMLALTYEFAGGFVLFFGHPWVRAQFNYYPLIWLAWDSWFRGQRWWSFPLATAAVAGVFNAGNLQSDSYLVLFSVAILIGYAGTSAANWKRILPIVAISGMLGASLACPVLLGEIELFAHATRNIALALDLKPIGGVGTISAFYPWAIGTFRTLDLGKFFDSSNMGFCLFIGSAALLASLFSAIHGVGRGELSPVRRTSVWLVAMYLAIACTPLVGVLYVRSAGLGVLGATALAAAGVEKLFTATSPMRRWASAIIVLLVITVMSIHVAALVVYPKFIPKIRQLVAERVSRTPTGMREAAALREFQINNFANEVTFKNPETVLACLGVLLFAGLCLRPEMRKQRWTLPALLALNLAPPVMFARRFVPVQPMALWQRLMAPDTEPRCVADMLNVGHLRLLETLPIEFHRLYPNAMAHYFHVHTVHGYASLQPPNFDTLPSAELKQYLPQAADYVYGSASPNAPSGQLKKNPTPGLARFQWADGVAREIRVEKETMNTIELVIGPGRGEDLIRTDTYYPGWSANIGTEEIAIQKSAPFFSRIRIPAGRQTVTLHYTPTYLRPGIALACVGAILTIVVTFLAFRFSNGRDCLADS